MRVDQDALGKIVVAKFGDGTISAVGRVIGYCHTPTVTIENAKGERIHWRADMCDLKDLSVEEAAALFKQ